MNVPVALSTKITRASLALRPTYDVEADRPGRYPHDGVRTVCFEKASGTYVYDGTRLRLIVDGD